MNNYNDFFNLAVDKSDAITNKSEAFNNIFEDIVSDFVDIISAFNQADDKMKDTLLYKPQNFHARFYYYEPNTGIVKAPRGGITVAYRTPESPEDFYRVGIAVCSLHDNYCKKTGVKTAENYILQNDSFRSSFLEEPMTMQHIRFALELAINDNYKHFRKEFLHSPMFREIYNWSFQDMIDSLHF